MHRWMSMLNNIGLPQSFHLTYIVEILILTVIIYELLIWVKNTRAWTLLKGIVVVTAFALISYFFHLTTLTWLMSLSFSRSYGVPLSSWEEKILFFLFLEHRQ